MRKSSILYVGVYTKAFSHELPHKYMVAKVCMCWLHVDWYGSICHSPGWPTNTEAAKNLRIGGSKWMFVIAVFCIICFTIQFN